MHNTVDNLQMEHLKAIKQVFKYEQAKDYDAAMKELTGYLTTRQNIMILFGHQLNKGEV